MTSKIKVDNINKVSDDTNIIKKCGTTITLGASGDSIALASGASQTGFGRNGSVNWQTSIKTGDFTAVNGEGYFINTTSGTITMTLPSSPSVGDIVAFKDYAGTFDNNSLTIGRNGSNIVGGATNPTVSVEGQAGTLIYGDATQGWQIVEAATNTDLPRPAYIAATGGTVTTVCTNFKVHTFTGPGTFCVSSAGNSAGSNTISYMVVAGGGGGGGGYQGGGGGAGGFREGRTTTCSYTVSPLNAPAGLPVTATGYPVTVGGAGGGGGAASPATSGNRSSAGNNSVFAGSSTITSAGGGSAGAFSCGSAPPEVGGNGGSGGGAARSPATVPGGTGNSPPTSPAQGTNGGSTTTPYASPFNGGGGGGATVAGTGGGGATVGVGGAGATTSINGTPTAYAGGGGSGGGTKGSGGAGGGGNGAGCTPGSAAEAADGTTNSGGGGGGGQQAPGIPTNAGGAGGSGVVIIRYKFQ